MRVDELSSLLVLSCLVEQCGMFEQQVVALGHEMQMLLKHGEALGVRLLHALVELVEFHEYAAVGLIKTKGTLHALESLLCIVVLVAVSQCQIAPYGWELRVELR